MCWYHKILETECDTPSFNYNQFPVYSLYSYTSPEMHNWGAPTKSAEEKAFGGGGGGGGGVGEGTRGRR